ncbi:hypothetical protein PoB_003160600 [Plakobranchus ocellatus]|uniref:DUF19 domain-containing protein n=1 Tax=Plakobranchus ocellatus TaxID=259542 RepID=A0AAV4AEM4_9GAST|nr:hypothetical protein PoB_003160600 [Plakobranchus ocellatus]
MSWTLVGVEPRQHRSQIMLGTEVRHGRQALRPKTTGRHRGQPMQPRTEASAEARYRTQTQQAGTEAEYSRQAQRPNTAIYALFVSEVSGNCNALYGCERILGTENLYSEQFLILSFRNAESLEKVCPNLPKFQECVDKNLASCEHEWARSSSEINLALYKYLCSPRGQELASKVANSDCATDSENEVRLFNEITACYETFETDMSVEPQQAQERGRDVSSAIKCKYVMNLKQCLIDTAPKDCHDDMSAFIKDIWSHAAGKKHEDLYCVSEARSRVRVKDNYCYRCHELLPLLSPLPLGALPLLLFFSTTASSSFSSSSSSSSSANSSSSSSYSSSASSSSSCSSSSPSFSSSFHYNPAAVLLQLKIRGRGESVRVGMPR